MDNISQFHPIDFRARQAVTFEMLEFLLRALEYRLKEVNDGASEGEGVELEHFIEIQLADIAHLERQLAGIGEAVSRWLAQID